MAKESSLSATEKRNARGYAAQLAGAMAIYAVVLALALTWLQHKPPGPSRYLVALLPMIPLALVPVIVLRFVRRMDELWRRIHLEALAFAFPVGVLIATSYGFLQLAGLPVANWIWVWPLFLASWGLGLSLARARYR